ncbi:MAG: hypothetical protein HY608_11850 [Planctomycetes bacterium]|nr:hypothetical protein [Planctomycetota bacterium]
MSGTSGEPLDALCDAAGEVVAPMLRLPAEHDETLPEFERLLRDLGCHVLLFNGGNARSTPRLMANLLRSCPMLRVTCADFEEGPGQRMKGAPWGLPMMALGAAMRAGLSEGEVEAYAEALGRASIAHGANAVFAPVCDLATARGNPIVGTRSLGDDPAEVSRSVAALTRGFLRAGALSCAKHFPGHGETLQDSHSELPRVTTDAGTLRSRELAPFHAAVEAGVPMTMTAHVLYEGVDRERPATLSDAALGGLLRGELSFRGACVSDSLRMSGILDGRTSEEAGVGALRAGCDILLDPEDPAALRESVRKGVREGRIDPVRISEALARVRALAARAVPTGLPQKQEDADDLDRLSERLAARAITPVGKPWRPPGRDRLSVAVIDDDEDIDLSPLLDTLRVAGARPALTEGDAADLAVLAGRVAAWKGRAGLSETSARRLERLLASRSDLPLLVLGSPALLPSLWSGRALVAYGAQAPIQRAVAGAILGDTPAPGRLPVRWPGLA